MPGGEIAPYLDSLRDRIDKHRVALGSSLDEFYFRARSQVGSRPVGMAARRVRIGSHFNAFRFLQPDENGLSRVIAELLRPKGRHRGSV